VKVVKKMKFQVKVWRKIEAPPEFKEVSFTFYTWEEVKTALRGS
jgi:ribosomal protein S3AE